MARILITGTSGLLGLNLALDAVANHQVIGVDRQQLVDTPFKQVNVDLLGPGAVEQVLVSTQPDWLIHCAALANLEACEADPPLAHRLNALLPGSLADACAQHSVRMVYISTDAVFDGTKDGSYLEDDIPNPLGTYARTKLEGEHAVLETNPAAIVARVNFYGWSMSGTRSLAEFFFYNLRDGKTVNGFNDVWFCPTFVGDLADLLLAMLVNELRGLYHVVSAGSMTKYDFGIAIARRFGFDEGSIQPKSIAESNLTARRAHNLKLSIHKLSTVLSGQIPTFSTGLERFYTQFQQGYPQKIRSYQQV